MEEGNIDSLAAKDLAIDEVLDLRTGEIIAARRLIEPDKEKVLQLRMALSQGISAKRPLMACPLCGVPVHLVSMMKERKFYFRHEIEDGRCPAETKGTQTPNQILAMKYDGARESEAHYRMKHIVADSLAADPDFSGIEIEKIWRGSESKSRRKPDVRAIWKKRLPVAFEVQLSTTFLRVIAERREFYLREGGLLFWVFKEFDMGNARLAMEDVFYNNNRNAFVASEGTLAASQEARSLVLDCVWSEPELEDGKVLWSPRSGRCTFSGLTKDQEKQRVFHFDADAARAKCKSQLVEQPLRDAFRHFWFFEVHDHAVWLRLRAKLADHGVHLPFYLSEADALRPLLDTLYSAEAGKPVAGWGQPNIVVLAHHVFTKYKGFLWAFRIMLAAHEHVDVIRANDPTGKWRSKVDIYKKAWTTGSTEFKPDRRYDRLVCFLFPEIADRLLLDPS
ncbi:DUF6035 family protein [Hydrogenophaga sp. NFH-34]|uniref:DUF6035 family protein n=1 Tax=Hydrogenophaga sp. NFH-34 TaxID=2744446 RepID=UPI001F3D4E13|nr:DUF6035 family protein [Hydrogenophaga sp. NFH-34]